MPCGGVCNGGGYAGFAWGVFVDDELHEFVFFASVSAFEMGKAEEETLSGGVAAESHVFLRMLLKVIHECVVSDGKAAKVGDVFAEGEFAIDSLAVDTEVVKLLHEHGSFFIKTFLIFSSPPIFIVAVAIKECALVIKTVRHFVADDDTDCAVIDSVVTFVIEEGVLEDSGREDDFIHVWREVGIHHVWRHKPFVMVDRLPELSIVVVHFVTACAHDVANIVSSVNMKSGIHAPRCRVADFTGHFTEFHQSLLFCPVRHPVEILDAGAEGNKEIINKCIHVFLCILREVATDILFAENVGNTCIDCTEHTLPKRLLLFAAAHNLAVEFECCCADCTRKHACRGVEQSETEVYFPGAKRCFCKKLRHLLQILWLLHEKMCR